MKSQSNTEIDARKWRRSYKNLFTWNSYQLDLFSHLEKPSGNISVRARAGSGKTTTIAGCVAALPSNSKIAIFAFNKHIADKLKTDPRIPSGRVSTGTAHSFGNYLLTSYFGGQQIEVDPGKYTKIAKNLANKIIEYRAKYEIDLTQVKIEKITEEQLKNKWGEFPPPRLDDSTKEGKLELALFIRFIKEASEFAMKTLTDPESLEDLQKMIDHYDVDKPEKDSQKLWGLRAVKHAILEGEKVATSFLRISFEEMLYFPYKWNLQPPQKDWIIVDEAQDASPAQIALYKSYCDQGAKIVYVGDDKQAIMGFSGADTNSWNNLAEAFKPKELPLSICYRCPDSHLNLARRIVSDVESRPDAPKGKIEVIHPDKITESMRPGDLGICRLTAPLISTCLKLLVQGKPAYVRGRAIGDQLVAIAIRAKAGVDWPISFKVQVATHIGRLLNSAREDENEEMIEQLNDQKMALFYFWDAFGDTPTFEEFCNQIKSLFDDEDRQGIITLSTIHRAKGDEADRVFIIGSQMLPFTFKASKGWQIEQEKNITYVALTRSKSDLFLIPYPYTEKDEEKLKEWLEHPLGGMNLPESKPSQKQFDPLDLCLGATIKARNLEWELDGFDLEESGDIYLLLSRNRSSATARINWNECKLLKNGIEPDELPPPKTIYPNQVPEWTNPPKAWLRSA
ncbi:MAG: UvrD-helicase domain-containing protein [Limnoraphis robusta]